MLFLLLLSSTFSHPHNITLLFESYEGHWFEKPTDSPGSNHRLRVHLDWNPRNLTSIHPIHSSFFYSTSPTAIISQNNFLTTGFYVSHHFLLIYSSAPMVQIQESLTQYLSKLNSSIPNLTHNQIHSGLLTSLSTPDTSPVVTWLLYRNCTFLNQTEVCQLTGTQRWRNSTVFLQLRNYNFLEFQTRWRSMIALCGLAVSLMLFTLKHEHVRWSDVSPLSLFASQTGEYAIVLLFYHRKDDFDLGGSEGFVFVAIWAASIPFYFLAVRFETSTRAYSRVNGSEFDPPWLIKLWLIIGLLSGFTAFPQFAFFVKFSYWLPQIWFTALANHRRSVSLIYACGMTGGQLLFAGAIVKYHPMFEGMFVWIIGPVVVWSGLQLVVIMLQNLCGGAFFIPKRARQVRFDWRGERPAPGTECPVCLDVIEETQAFLATPCGHVFHDGCLRRWMDDHADCPFCRTVLPSIDVDSGEP